MFRHRHSIAAWLACFTSACADDGDFGALDSADKADKHVEVLISSPELTSLLQGSELLDACNRYWASDHASRQARLDCGKAMFFYESFGTAGVPKALVQWMAETLRDGGGIAERFGMFTNPYSQELFGFDGVPVGFGPGPSIQGVPTLSYTCASCHFAQLSDGRFAIGAPNHAYDYSGQVLTLMMGPLHVAPAAGFVVDFEIAPATKKILAPLLDATTWPRKAALLVILLDLAGLDPVVLSVEEQEQYASWPSGVMDSIITPLAIDDGAHVPTKIPATWGILPAQGYADAGQSSAFLNMTGMADSLEVFLEKFILIGGGDVDAWNSERLGPLIDFVTRLRAPTSLPQGSDTSRGEQIFERAGCAKCHDGVGLGGERLYAFDELGTDASLLSYGKPDANGRSTVGLDHPTNNPLGSVKAPRLIGIAAHQRFLHNGSVGSLEALFTCDPHTGMRAGDAGTPWSDDGHKYGCELVADEKQALILYLKSL